MIFALLMILVFFVLMMGLESLTFNRTITGGGINAIDSETVTGEARRSANPTIAATKTGTLSTRGSDTAGTLTMESGHGITTGARIDIYWDTVGSGNYVTSCTVGTVAGLSVPFTTAVGVLPIATTAVRACVANEASLPVVGDDIQALVAACGTAPALFVVADGSGDLATFYTTASGAFGWKTGDGTNPLAGDTATKVFISVDKAGTTTTTDAKIAAIVA